MVIIKFQVIICETLNVWKQNMFWIIINEMYEVDDDEFD